MMDSEYIEYQDNLKKHSRQAYGLVFLFFALACMIIIAITLLIIVLPFGLVACVPCVLLLRLAMNKTKACRETWQKIKTFKSSHVLSMNLPGNTTYCFVSPFPFSETLDVISAALSLCGNVESMDSLHGVVNGSIRTSSHDNRRLAFYVEKNDQKCKVRVCFYQIANDDWWDIFIKSLMKNHSDVDFCITPANGTPVIVGVLNLQNETEQVSFSKTKGGASLSRFLVGGALFGEAGAVVGGLSGKRRTITNTKTVLSGDVIARVVYSNGRLWEGTVQKGTALYNEIIVNMK